MSSKLTIDDSMNASEYIPKGSQVEMKVIVVTLISIVQMFFNEHRQFVEEYGGPLLCQCMYFILQLIQ